MRAIDPCIHPVTVGRSCTGKRTILRGSVRRLYAPGEGGHEMAQAVVVGQVVVARGDNRLAALRGDELDREPLEEVVLAVADRASRLQHRLRRPERLLLEMRETVRAGPPIGRGDPRGGQR